MTIRGITSQIQSTETIRDLTEALGDIATAKLKATRSSIEHTVSYFQEVSIVYRTVKSLAMRANLAHLLKPKNKPVISVLLTSNTHLYGGLDLELTKFFISNMENIKGDVLVVGSFGKQLLQAYSFDKPYLEQTFKKDSPNPEELRLLSEKVFSYQTILVFYSKFATILSQKPFISNISTAFLTPEHKSKDPIQYITEPELLKILVFFETHILGLLFQSIFLEVDLSRTAARMISMNQAEVNANKLLSSQKKSLLRARKQLLNLRILEAYTGRKVKAV